jgi:hypothetical protein
VSSLDGIPNQHPFLDRLVIDTDIDAGFLCEFNGGIAVAFDDQVVENDAVQVPRNRQIKSVQVTLSWDDNERRRSKDQRAKVIKLSFNVFRRDSHFAIKDLIRDMGRGRRGVEERHQGGVETLTACLHVSLICVSRNPWCCRKIPRRVQKIQGESSNVVVDIEA